LAGTVWAFAEHSGMVLGQPCRWVMHFPTWIGLFRQPMDARIMGGSQVKVAGIHLTWFTFSDSRNLPRSSGG
jgi:hypothetical protein